VNPGTGCCSRPGWAPPKGYSNGIEARGRVVAVGGQVGWDSQCRFHTSDFVGQARQALENIVAVLAEAGGRPEHIIRMTWYVLDKREYLAAYPRLGRRLSRGDRAQLPGHDRSAGGGPDGGRGAGRDRGDGGDSRLKACRHARRCAPSARALK
jgi:enamine deaminase RidA (YjgF/YER057c/UK114 family)